MSICLIQSLEQNGVMVITASLTLAALGFSIFGSIYSNLLHNAEMADGNALQGNEISKRYWRKASNCLRNGAKLRAYSANCCFWSLFFIILTLIFFLPAGNFCSTTFSIALVLLIVALVFAAFPCKCLLKLFRIFFWPVHPDVKKLTIDC